MKTIDTASTILNCFTAPHAAAKLATDMTPTELADITSCRGTVLHVSADGRALLNASRLSHPYLQVEPAVALDAIVSGLLVRTDDLCPGIATYVSAAS
jgi:hypothetical protein